MGAQRYSRHWFRALGHVLVCLQVDWLIRLIAGSCGMPQAQRYFRHWFRGLGYNLVCLYVNRGNTVDKYRRKKAPLRGLEGGKYRRKKAPLRGLFMRIPIQARNTLGANARVSDDNHTQVHPKRKIGIDLNRFDPRGIAPRYF